MDLFSAKERARFRKLLEVAHSSTFEGERDAALAAAARLAASHGMTLREAAGMSEAAEEPAARRRPTRTRPSGFESAFSAGLRAGGLHRDPRTTRIYSRTTQRPTAADEAKMDAEKARHDAAMADAIKRGLDAAERAAAAKVREFVRRPNKHAFRNRAEFIRVLLKETSMSARDIASTVGVPIHDVFREKLLMRKQPADETV